MARSPEEEVVLRMEGFVPPPARGVLEQGLRLFDWIVAGAFFAVVSLTAIGMGGNRDWAWAPVAVLVALFAIVIAMGAGTRSGFDAAPAERRPLAILILCFAAYVLFALFQMSTLAPLTASATYYEMAAKLLGQAHAPVPDLAIDAARNSLIKCLTCGAIFLCARALCRDRGRARLLLYIFLFGALLVLGYGFLSQATTNSCYLGSYLKKVGTFEMKDHCVMSGTFVSSNSFGSYCGMALVAALTLLFAPRRGQGHVPYGYGEQEEGFLSGLTGFRLVMLAISLLMLGGLLISASRAGLAATVATVGLVILLMMRGLWRARPDLTRLVIIGAVVVGIVVTVIAGRTMFMKLEHGGSVGERMHIWMASWKAITLSPWLGWGIGNFADIYTILQPASMTQPNDLAHSTPLEVMVEVGIPMAFVVYAILLIPWGATLYGALTIRFAHRYLPVSALAVATVPTLHSMIDFSLQMPAIGFVVSAMLGMGWAQAFARRERPEMPLRGDDR